MYSFNGISGQSDYANTPNYSGNVIVFRFRGQSCIEIYTGTMNGGNWPTIESLMLQSTLYFAPLATFSKAVKSGFADSGHQAGLVFSTHSGNAGVATRSILRRVLIQYI